MGHDEQVSITGTERKIKPRMKLDAEITFKGGKTKKVELLCRIDTVDALEYFKNGGILQNVLRNLAA